MIKNARFFLSDSNLKEALSLADDFCSSSEFSSDKSLCFKFKLIFEELVVNVFKHAVKLGATYLEIEIEGDSTLIKLRLVYNGEGFDPTKYEPDSLNKPLKDKKKGGVGLILVSKFAREFHYKRVESLNKIHVEIE